MSNKLKICVFDNDNKLREFQIPKKRLFIFTADIGVCESFIDPIRRIDVTKYDVSNEMMEIIEKLGNNENGYYVTIIDTDHSDPLAPHWSKYVMSFMGYDKIKMKKIRKDFGEYEKKLKNNQISLYRLTDYKYENDKDRIY